MNKQARRKAVKQAGIHTDEKAGGHVSNQGDIQAQRIYRRHNTCIHTEKQTNRQTNVYTCTCSDQSRNMANYIKERTRAKTP